MVIGIHQLFDAKTADESEHQNRVQVSKVVQAFDQLSPRNVKITLALKGEHNGDEAPNIDEDVKKTNAEIQAENRNVQAIIISNLMKNTITGKDTSIAKLRNQVDADLQYELNKVRARNDKLEHNLEELEETRGLANNRLQELGKLHQQHRDALKK
ncbi:hypothetical protein PV326_007676 [Microctonus aethiopoides]|nr:hypothetical protein PV326_007676 [Microctonus aethiopoides]